MDLGMVGNHIREYPGELEIMDFQGDEIVLVAAPSHPVTNLNRPTVDQVMELGLVAREVGSATRQSAELHFGQLGLVPKIAIELGSNQAVKQAASAGGGIGIISRLGITAALKAGMLVVVDAEGWECRRPLTLIQPKDRYLSPSQTAFHEFLMAERTSFTGLAPTS